MDNKLVEADKEEDGTDVYSKVNYMNIRFAIAISLIRIDGKLLKLYGAPSLNNSQSRSEHEGKRGTDACCFVQYFDLFRTDDLSLDNLDETLNTIIDHIIEAVNN